MFKEDEEFVNPLADSGSPSYQGSRLPQPTTGQPPVPQINYALEQLEKKAADIANEIEDIYMRFGGVLSPVMPPQDPETRPDAPLDLAPLAIEMRKLLITLDDILKRLKEFRSRCEA